MTCYWHFISICRLWLVPFSFVTILYLNYFRHSNYCNLTILDLTWSYLYELRQSLTNITHLSITNMSHRMDHLQKGLFYANPKSIENSRKENKPDDVTEKTTAEYISTPGTAGSATNREVRFKPEPRLFSHLLSLSNRRCDHISYTFGLRINWKIHYMQSAQSSAYQHSLRPIHTHTHPCWINSRH